MAGAPPPSERGSRHLHRFPCQYQGPCGINHEAGAGPARRSIAVGIRRGRRATTPDFARPGGGTGLARRCDRGGVGLTDWRTAVTGSQPVGTAFGPASPSRVGTGTPGARVQVGRT